MPEALFLLPDPVADDAFPTAEAHEGGTHLIFKESAYAGFSVLDEQSAESAPDLAAKADAKAKRDQDEKKLIQLCAEGSQSAFSELYSRLAPVLFSMIYQVLRDQKEAEDALQEAFLQIWKKSASFDPARGTVLSWATMMARSRAIDRFRASRRRNELKEEAAADQAVLKPDFYASPDHLSGLREDAGRVRAALGDLSEAQRAVIQLAFFSGLTHSEIAAKLGAPMGTVKGRIRRGLLALRDALAIVPAQLVPDRLQSI